MSTLLLSSIGKGFINQHDRDVVFDGIEQSAGFANQAIPGSIQEDIPFTFWTGQNFQELFTDGHFHPPFLIPVDAILEEESTERRQRDPQRHDLV